MTLSIDQTESGKWERRAAPHVNELTHVVARALGVTTAAVMGPHRGTKAAALARQIAMYLAHTRLKLTYTEAGRAFGRDRTTVAYACRRIEESREKTHIDSLVDLIERLSDARSPALGEAG